MASSVVLCVDAESACRPELVGLAGERLDVQSWLDVYTSGETARTRLQEDSACVEAWVVSCDDVDSINLAAALKQDAPSRNVFLVSFSESGSLKSRASAAGIDGLLDCAQFARRYSLIKQASASRSPARERPEAQGARASGECSQGERGVDGRSERAWEHSDFLRDLDLGERRFSAETGRSRDRTDSSVDAMGAVSKERRGAAKADAASQPYVLVVASAHGGSGKSTVAVLSAVLAHEQGYRTLLLDADLQFGDVHTMLGVEDPCTLEDVLQGKPLPEASSLPSLIAAPKRLEDSERIAKDLATIIERVGSAFDLVVVDTGPLWGEPHAVLLERASCVLFLIDQRSSSLQATKHALELCGRCGIPTTPFLYAVNRCKRGAPLSSIDASCSLQGASVVELRDGGRAVDELLSAGLPRDLFQDENPLCTSLERALDDVLPPLSKKRERAKEDSVSATRALRFGGLEKLRRKVACLC